MTRARLALAVVLAASCAKDAHELSPFPCARDLTCPDGLACVDGACAPAQLDAVCTAGNDPTDCSVAGAGVVCSAGLGSGSGSGTSGSIGACEIPCTPSCPSGRACSSGFAGAVCLLDCTDPGVTCPTGTTCKARNFDTSKVCLPPGVLVQECQTVSNPVVCNKCGAQSASQVQCPNGTSTCPSHSTCNDTSTLCSCEPGTKAVDCSGNPCNGQCTGTNWWCEPDVSGFTCTHDLFAVSGACVCFGGRTINVACNDNGVTCEDLCQR